MTTSEGVLRRVHGSTGDGSKGVPVAGGFDCDGDGFGDYSFAAMQASPFGRNGAGEVYLVFGDGSLDGMLDTAGQQADILKIAGDGAQETAGSELWMDDVTGDGLGDLLIARQNFTLEERTGAGALTIVVGGSELRTHAATLQHLDLRFPPAALTLATFVGAEELGRLGIWMRTGDVTGDGIADIVVGADQEDGGVGSHRGAAYLIRGGAHLAVDQTVDLAGFGSTTLAGHVARIEPPPGTNHLHFGATVQIADLDGNGRAEVLAAAALNRSGATIEAAGAPPGSAHGGGGTTDGTLYIAWDNNFATGLWPDGYAFEITASPGARSVIDGASLNRSFGEEILGGLDYDGDGRADLFVGDIVGDLSPGQDRPNAGSGHVLYDAATLRGLEFDLGTPPPGLVTTTFLGAEAGDIASDTAAQGDFDGDGFADLAFSSPHGSPLSRPEAGIVHVFFGQSGAWPAAVDLAALPPVSQARITEIYGANGSSGSDTGDVLCYSAAAGDLDGDLRTDLVTNEMLGNGLGPGTEDVGNLILVSGAVLSPLLGTPCSDLVDNDGDGLVDYPVDPGCSDAADTDERGAFACDDGADNDGDGLVDLADAGCASAGDLSERSASLPCDDGVDNDGDGRGDYDPATSASPGDANTDPAGQGDPGCKSPTWGLEDPLCQDGVDNDGDGKIDYDAGRSIHGFGDANGPDPQCEGTGASAPWPWRNRETNSGRCGLGFELALVLTPFMLLRRRRLA